jgi:nitric oxide reductase NorQ protein
VPHKLIEDLVATADAIRRSADLDASLSVRATDEACVYLKHPLFSGEARTAVPEVLKSSFCGRFSGRYNDVTTDAGAVWAVVTATLRERGYRIKD